METFHFEHNAANRSRLSHLFEEVVAADVVRVAVRADDDVDVPALHPSLSQRLRDLLAVPRRPGGQFNSFVEISTDFSTDFSTEFL